MTITFLLISKNMYRLSNKQENIDIFLKKLSLQLKKSC
jgi:hypothetical protein